MSRPSRHGELLDIGVDVLHRRGYSATTVESITELASVSKGAFFNYFGSKEAFTVEALRRYFGRWQEQASRIVGDLEMNAADKLRALIAAAADGGQETSYSFGCLIGNLSAELSSEHESIRSTLSEIFWEWALTFETAIEAGQKDGELSTALRPAQAARFLVNGLQGALLRCKVERTSTALVDLEEIAFRLLLPSDKKGTVDKAMSRPRKRPGGRSL
jgi:TetR/AcrR family transcriptional regulator, transcriptional repressor for nem operon